MQPSQRQQDILDVWTSTDENILISAVAGSGKTTALMMLLEKCESRVLFVAFNKSIQAEIQEKIDKKGLSQGKAMTMHSLGLTAIKSTGKRININANKNWDLLKKLQIANRSIYRHIAKEDFNKVNYALMDIIDVSRMIVSDDLEEIKAYMITMDKIIPDLEEIAILWEKLVELRDLTYEQKVIEIDFLDMIYLPVIKDLEIPIYATYLFVDECQDLNIAQHKLINKLLEQETLKKWIAVGDRNQAIYGFSGASSKSFDLFLERGNVREMPLDICYRCSTKIVEKANQVYDIMFPSPTAPEGIVDIETNIEDIKPDSMIICRNTNPLFELYFRLLGAGKPCYINGKDIMTNLIKFIKPYMRDTIHSATLEMGYKFEDLSEKMDSEEGRIRYYIFKENYSNFISIAKHVCEPLDSMETLVNKLKELFEIKEGAIMLCTIHKSKGLEADIVYILNESTTIPSKFAKSSEQLKQEKNLKYVARTRAKKEMYFLNLTNSNTENLEDI